MDTNTHITQIQAQILNDYIKRTYSIRIGWVRIYAMRSCAAISAWINREYQFTSLPSELLEQIKR